MEILKSLYKHLTGHNPERIETLSAAGSNRRYYRLFGNPTLVGVAGTSTDENKAFIYLARHFELGGLPVPHVYAVSDDSSHYLQEDLGDTLLFNAIESGRLTGRFSPEEKELLRKTVRLLPKVQFEGAKGIDFTKCYPLPEMNRRCVMWDLNYFKYCFLKTTGMDFHEDRLEDDFQQLTDDLLADRTDTFMYRDFQSRNIMVRDGQPWLIDFQGGRRGPVYYDLASLLWQAKANLPQELKEELISEYLDQLGNYANPPRELFRERLRLFVLFRTLQVLGAYGFRGHFEGKRHFLESVPFAVNNLRDILSEGFSRYSYLTETLQRLTELPQFKPELKATAKRQPKLTVRIVSFSYKKGIPVDPSGNGGGYVFDCRGVHNPGKYERYRHMTGKDDAVIKFLEDDGEITRFLEHVYQLVDAHVSRFIERDFSSLMVCFGCTGGQHRSVYSAEHLAKHLREKFGVNVELTHREI